MDGGRSQRNNPFQRCFRKAGKETMTKLYCEILLKEIPWRQRTCKGHDFTNTNQETITEKSYFDLYCNVIQYSTIYAYEA